jgi:hypothetical protein
MVGQHRAREAGLLAELVQATRCLGGGWSTELGVFVGVDHRQEVFASGQGLAIAVSADDSAWFAAARADGGLVRTW